MTKTKSKSSVYCGIDVAKKTLDASLNQKHCQVKNDPDGWRKLIAWVAKIDRNASIACEATGGYERLMIRAFQKAGYLTYVLQPLRVRQYAESMGYLAKTDKIDAAIIALFAAAKPPMEAFEPTVSQESLTALVSFQGEIKLKIVALENQITMLLDPLAIASANRLLKAHKKEIIQLNKALAKVLSEDAKLQEKVDKLTAFQGVGKITALAVLAHLPELGTLSDAKITGLAGLAPYNRDSGPHKGKRSIRGGRGDVRKSLYMASLTAARMNPVLSKMYQRLILAGKPHKVALTALMRKLLVALNACLANPNFNFVS